jgi:1,4-dihydroxy-6-naphthoate synthase
MPTEKILRVGHSPDADDAYMFYGFAKEAVKIPGWKIEHVVEDIQSLNRRALKAELEVTAISAAVYPAVADQYWIMSCGASVGRNYGPILVAEKPFTAQGLKGKKIAVPGPQTTAFLLLNLFLDGFEPVQMDFNAVIPAVKEGKADAALVIHEGQLNFGSFGLTKCMDLGELWFDRYKLPIPLGLDMIRKDLGHDEALRIQKGLYDSIRYAMANETPALDYAAQFGRGTVGSTLKKFVGMYVNQDTLDLGKEGKEALEILFSKGAEKGLFRAPKVEVLASN